MASQIKSLQILAGSYLESQKPVVDKQKYGIKPPPHCPLLPTVLRKANETSVVAE